MGDTLSPTNTASALFGNTIATGAILVVLILMFGPISGAHFNPAVTFAREFSNTFSGIAPGSVPGFVIAQLAGALVATYFCLWLIRQSHTSVNA